MRWLFLILLLLNGVLLGWFYQEQQGRARMAERAASEELALTPLVLMDEVEPDRLHRRAKPQPDLKPAPSPVLEKSIEALAEVEPPPVAVYCHRIGHFASSAQAKVFGQGVDITPGHFEVIEGPVPLAPDYWVYLPRPGSAAERAALQRDLKVDGLESYWVRRGELKGVLSLGLYRRKASADALYAALVNKGYPAKLYRKARFEPGYFIEIETQNSEFPSSLWLQALKRDHPELKNEKKSCSGLATAKIPK